MTFTGAAALPAPAHIASLTPSHGQTGTVVTVSGTGLVPGATSVAFEHAILIDPSHVTVNPAGTTATFSMSGIDEWTYFWGGKLFVSMVTAGGQSNQLIFTAEPHPVAYRPLSPGQGPAAGGTRITLRLSGTMDPVLGFDVEGAVVGGVRVIAPVSLTRLASAGGKEQWALTFVTPRHAAGRVRVSLISFVPVSGPALTFRYLARPAAAPPPATTSSAPEPELPDTGADLLAVWLALIAPALIAAGIFARTRSGQAAPNCD